jgi:hypothetical protein
MSQALGPSLPQTTSVIRMVLNREDYYNSDKGEVQAPAFAFSTDEQQDTPHRLSVFDMNRTDIRQARCIHNKSNTLAFSLSVDGIYAIAPKRLQVLYDPLPADHRGHECNGPDGHGADGHSAIVGLYRPPGEPSQITRNMRSRLADLCERLREPDSEEQ